MSDKEVEALLERLVRQFASPYDFLRELVQNAMDAGSDLVEVVLRSHPGDHDEEVVHELVVVDAGEGMDETIIDGELTRLFASSKREDRTMAGGFGIGFVSVFAWEPEAVLLRTGRRDESWELVFDNERQFQKHRLDEPFEGTTVRMFRRGRRAEGPVIADAIRDSLWRWCRYVPIEVSFEEEEADTGPELIADAPMPDDAVVSAELEDGETRIRVAFAVPSQVVLLRHGLVLAEGLPAQQLPAAVEELGSTMRHLRVWADSPRLRTSMARDKVVDDEGRAAVDADVRRLVEGLRDELLDRVEGIAADPAPWSERTHERFSYLHTHLACEHHARERAVQERTLLRSPAGTAVSVAGLGRRARVGVVAAVPPGPVTNEAAELRVAAGQCGVPMVVARWPEDRRWLEPLLARHGKVLLPVGRAVSRILPEPGEGDALANMVMTLLQFVKEELGQVRLAKFDGDAERPMVGIEGAPGCVVTGGPLPMSWARGRALWLNAAHPLVLRALAAHARRPLLAAYTIAAAIGGRLGIEELRAEKLTTAAGVQMR